MAEIWKTVVGFSDYEVSDLGRVRRSQISRQGHKPGRILKAKLTRFGYHEVRLYGQDKPSCQRVNRLVCEAFNGPAPKDKPFALHADDIKLNNTPGNLYWGDRKENGHDAVLNSRYLRGGNHPRYNDLSDQEIRDIRSLAEIGDLTFKQIGDRFGISTAQAHRIYHRVSRGNVQ